MLTAIFFDVGGTLIHPDMSRLMAPLLARVQPNAEQLVAAERASKFAAPRKSGEAAPPGAGPVNKGHWEIYFETLLDALGCGHDLLPELTARAGNSDHWRAVDPAAAPTLRQLQRDYRLGIISNADGRIGNVLARGGLAQFFEKIIDSGLIGYEKPDPRIFQAALQQMGAEASQSLYVGDIHGIDYLGAIGAGMKAVLLDPEGIYREWNVACIASLSELPQWIANL